MAHYAKLDENNVVLDVIVIDTNETLDENGNENEEKGRAFCELLTGHAKWKRTSYNTKGGVYYDPVTNLPDQTKAYRLNFGQPGYVYDEELDGFVQGSDRLYKICSRMVINPTTGLWVLPWPSVPMPSEDEQLDQYPLETYYRKWFWDEGNREWIKVQRAIGPPPLVFKSDVLY